ncbi:uncharacterized protein BDFB_014570, partial [Asbolus verrucosus]
LLCATCVACAYDSIEALGIGNRDFHHVGIMYTAFAGYILINMVFITSYFINDTIPYKTSALFSISGAAIFIVTGVLLIVERSTHIRHYSYDPSWFQIKMLIVTVIFSFANAAVLTVDTILICAACMGFIYEPAKALGMGSKNLHHTGIMYTAYTGYMLINTLLLISRGVEDRMPYRT